MSKQIIILHEANAYNKDLIAMTLPLFLMAFFFYGPRVLVLALVAWVTARLCDRLAALLRSRPFDKTDNSSVAFAFILVLMMPASVRFRVVVAAVMVAVLIGKEAFGGYGSYPFNPAALGWCAAAVSWPEEMLRYPPVQNWMLNVPQSWQGLLSMWRFENVKLMEGPSYILRNAALPGLSNWQVFLGSYAAPMGVSAILVILACGVYLFIRKRLSLVAPLCFLAAVVFTAAVFPRYGELHWAAFPGDILVRLDALKYELLSGALLFSAVFMVNEPVTLPKNRVSQAIYGLLLGFAAMMFRYFGVYELGTCFAFLLVNALSGFIDRAVARGGKALGGRARKEVRGG